MAEAAPWGVDAASRLESAPGRKDRDLVRAFVAAAKAFQGPAIEH
jgi:phosphoribosylanthranilate isomerase